MLCFTCNLVHCLSYFFMIKTYFKKGKNFKIYYFFLSKHNKHERIMFPSSLQGGGAVWNSVFFLFIEYIIKGKLSNLATDPVNYLIHIKKYYHRTIIVKRVFAWAFVLFSCQISFNLAERRSVNTTYIYENSYSQLF